MRKIVEFARKELQPLQKFSPKTASQSQKESQQELFREKLEQLADPGHGLVRRAHWINSLMSGAGFNFRKPPRVLLSLFQLLISERIERNHSPKLRSYF